MITPPTKAGDIGDLVISKFLIKKCVNKEHKNGGAVFSADRALSHPARGALIK